jgi:hypothetical protein
MLYEILVKLLFLFQILILGCFDGTLIVCLEKGQQSVVNTKLNPFHFKLCGSYNSDNFVVADFKKIEYFNNSQVIIYFTLV